MEKFDPTALFHIRYGLYILTAREGSRDNGLVVNTVFQVTNSPDRIAVAVNKNSFSYHIIKNAGIMNVNCLEETAPFSLFQTFGFQSGRTVDKFADTPERRSQNGLRITDHTNAYISLETEQLVELDTHGVFLCGITESRVLSQIPTMTYDRYLQAVKPKTRKDGYVCRVCGWVYEGKALPEDIICPVCGHGAGDFKKL